MSKIKKILLVSIMFIFLETLLPICVLADGAANVEVEMVSEKGMMSGVREVCLNEGQCEFSDVLQIIANVFKLLRSVAFYVAIGFAIYGGIKMIISQGDPKGLSASQKTLLSAFIGILIAYGASFIVNIVITLILGYPLSYDAIVKANWLK